MSKENEGERGQGKTHINLTKEAQALAAFIAAQNIQNGANVDDELAGIDRLQDTAEGQLADPNSGGSVYPYDTLDLG